MSTNEAGRARRTRGLTVALLVVWGLVAYVLFALALARPTRASAYELHTDGTITGTCRVWRDPDAPYISYTGEGGLANFTLKLDTGDVTEVARCIDNGIAGALLRYAPANGSTVSYTAVPQGDGMYMVTTDGTGVPVNPEEEGVFSAAGLVVSDMNAQRIRGYLKITPPTGYATLVKKSAIPSWTSANACYDLSGAEYGVYSDANCATKVGTLTTAADGSASSLKLAVGTYYVRETKAPARGYALDGATHEVTVASANTAESPATVTVSDQPLTDALVARVQKQDLAQDASASGDTSDWAGFRFRLTHYAGTTTSAPADASATWETTADGALSFEGAETEGAWAFKDAGGSNVFPLGLYVIEEASPSGSEVYKGYVGATGNLQILVTDDGTHTASGIAANKSTRATGDWKSNGTANVSATQTVVTLRERPATSRVRVTKTDADGVGPQGDATLSGATFTFCNASRNPVTTPDGSVIGVGAVAATATVRWDDSSRTWSTDDVTLSAGTYTVRESQPPEGYREDTGWTQTITVDGTTELVELSRANEVKRGGIAGNKVDANLDSAYAQGDASLAGANIAIVNASAASVVVNGVAYAPGQTVMTVPTDGGGSWQTAADSLPYGTYTVHEASPSPGYLLNDEWSDTYLVRGDGAVVSHTTSGRLQERVVRGGVSVGKTDAENGQHLNTGDATLAGAEFEVRNSSQRGVWAQGDDGERLYLPGEVILTLVTDEAGVATSKPDALPYGSYTVRESKAPEGYLLDAAWTRTFSIRENGVLCDLSSEDDSASDQPKRMGFSFQKKVGGSMETMPNTAFLLVANSDADGDGTHEAHVIVTDENGCLSTEDFDRGARDNKNDAAAALPEGAIFYDGDAGRWTVDTSKVVVDSTALDPQHGVWFTGRTDLTTRPSEHASLPYDTYTVAELPCEANEGLTLVTFSLVVRPTDRRMDQERDLGTVDDSGSPRISTSATGDGEGGQLACSDTASLTDFVDYSNLIPGRRYTLTGTLVDKVTGDVYRDASGKAVTSEVAFRPTLPYGVQEMTFSFDGSNLSERQSLVAFERLTMDGKELASHTDLNDEHQTVSIAPAITTSVTCTQTGLQMAPAQAGVTVVDTVTYRGLQAGTTYTLTGSLHLVGEDGSDAGPVDGTTVTQEFVPEATTGTVDVSFALDARSLGGSDVVAFEQVTRGGETVASHADITDERQTIHVPTIATAAQDAVSRTHHLTSSDEAMDIVDNVAYDNLVPGRTYAIAGTLHVRSDDGTDAGALRDADGEPISSEVEFTPTSPCGVVEIPFEADSSLVSGKAIVVFEAISLDDVVLVEHEDIEDAAQTLYAPALRTSARDAEDGDAYVPATGTVQIVDTISYSGLEAGREYQATATVHEVSDQAEELGTVEGAIGSLAFVPKTSSGKAEVTVEFEMPASLGAERLVVFEELTSGDVPVASHADPTDESQTLFVPSLRTTATDRDTGTHEGLAQERTTLTDEVMYSRLAPGTEHVVQGVVHVKGSDGRDLGVLLEDGTVLDDGATQEQLIGAHEEDVDVVSESESDPVCASATFVPSEPEGMVSLDFNIDATSIAGHQLVVFEKVWQGSVLYAEHADIADASQTVTYPALATHVEQDGIEARENQIVTDLVTYEGLHVDEEYVLVGMLMDAETGESVAGVTTEPVGFAPASPTGQARVTFLLDTSELEGRSLVVFETLLDGEGHVIARHADLTDAGQSVRVMPSPRPKAMQATEPEQGSSDGVPSTGDTTGLMAPAIVALAGIGVLVVGLRTRRAVTQPRRLSRHANRQRRRRPITRR